MSKEHSYKAEIKWTGNLGTGTSKYTAYSRAHEVSGDGGKQTILASADPDLSRRSIALQPGRISRRGDCGLPSALVSAFMRRCRSRRRWLHGRGKRNINRG